jgi:flagellar assembly protein FliH
MSSRIIRGDDRIKKVRVTASVSSPDFGGGGAPVSEVIGQDHVMNVEKQAFEQGYKEGERIGKQMGERMVSNAVQRYDRSIHELAAVHRSLRDAMEKEAVRLALAVAKKIVQREVQMDQDLIAALVSVALKRIQGQSGVTVRVSSHDHARLETSLRAVNAPVALTEDQSLERGDFVLDSIQTHVDGRISGQIETIARALLDE